MKISNRIILLIACSAIILSSCASKKRKADKKPNVIDKLYHNTTAQYNGYFNANEIMKETYLQLSASHQDNYTELLPLYDYTTNGAAKSHEGELERAIEKVTTVAMLHETSDWVDDCYVLLGEAQFIKQDFESAEETFEYFKEEFDPSNPFGRNYQKKKVSKKAIKKQKEKERKEKAKLKEAQNKKKKKERAAAKKEREEAQKGAAKKREAERKERAKAKKEKKKNNSRKKKKGKKRGKKKRPVKKEKETETIETPVETKVDTPVKVPVKTAKERAEENEKLKLEEERTPDVVDKDKKPKKKKIDKTAYSEGLMWLARTYVERDKYSVAKYLVRKMQNDEATPKYVQRELPIILADIYIKENNYTDAQLHLSEGIEKANDKKKKARYAFVAGQLSEKMFDYATAKTNFSNAKKWSTDFRMEFMAQLNAEKSSMKTGNSGEDVIANLDKMLKETKFLAYQDQLYFTKGEILLDEGKFQEALVSFRKSNVANTNNTPLKVETYYRLASLFYDREEYVDAKVHYDSTLYVIDKKDDRYREVKKYSENLTKIASLITSIELQDSLIALSKLDEKELHALAEIMVEKGLKAEKKRLAGPVRKSNLLKGPRSGLFNVEAYWAYNNKTRIDHAKKFEETWGDITLQDNWRISDRLTNFDDESEEVADQVSEEERKEKAIDQMIIDIKKQLPYSKQQKVDALALVESQLFELGKQYRAKLQNFPKAIEAHESLLKRFENTDKKLDTYYYLYLSNLEKPDNARAEYYRKKLSGEFPDSEFNKVVSNPEYAASITDDAQKLENYYRDTYAAFDSGDFRTAYEKASETENLFGKSALSPKFGLLTAMSIGSIQGKEVYVKELRKVISKYPNTPEKARAEEIMRFLQGDSKAFDNADMKEVDDIFTVEDNLKHYVAVVAYESNPASFDKMLIAVSNYNKKVHASKRLQLSDSSLNKEDNTSIILVRKFKNKTEAMEYYNDVVSAADDFVSTDLGGYSIYAVTQRNYRKMVIERSDSRYRLFFNKYYLDK